MCKIKRSHVQRLFFPLVLALVGVACGSSTTTVASPSDTEPAAEATAVATPIEADAPAPAAAVPDATVAPAAPATGGGGIDVALSDGRTWELNPVICAFDPGASGPAAAVLNISGYDDAGAEVNALEAWPFDGSTEGGTSFIGNFVTETGETYFFQEASATADGGVVELTTGYYLDVFYADGDPADGLITIRCTP